MSTTEILTLLLLIAVVVGGIGGLVIWFWQQRFNDLKDCFDKLERRFDNFDSRGNEVAKSPTNPESEKDESAQPQVVANAPPEPLKQDKRIK